MAIDSLLMTVLISFKDDVMTEKIVNSDMTTDMKRRNRNIAHPN